MALFQSLLDWTLSVFGPFGVAGLFAIAFAESSFFPFPPDALLIPFSLADPQNAFFFALVSTVGSVLGGLFGYWLGKRFGEPLLLRFAKKSTVEHVQKLYAELGFVAVLIAGFTPIPYKVFTIFSGVMEMDVKKFVLASIISRGLRFFLEAGVIYFYGPSIVTFLNQYFEIITLSLAVPLVLYLAWKYYRHRREKHRAK